MKNEGEVRYDQIPHKEYFPRSIEWVIIIEQLLKITRIALLSQKVYKCKLGDLQREGFWKVVELSHGSYDNNKVP